jgi:predicted dehydrogenase
MPVNFGQIGLGAWGKNLLRTFYNLADVNLKSAYDFDDNQISKLSALYPGIKWTSGTDEILSDSEIDAVVIATPPADHYELAKKAIEAGKDVFVEKPFVLDIKHGKQLLKLAEDSGRILMVGHIMEYHAATMMLKDYIDSGKLGDVYYLYSSRINLGKVRNIENALWSFAPHDISMINFLVGKKPVTVTATGKSYLQSNIEDVSFMTMHYDDKTMAHIHVSWLDPHKERKLTIVGSKMMAVFDDMAGSEKIRLYDKGVDAKLDYNTYGEYLALRVGDISIPKVPSSEPLVAECEHFVNCVINRSQPRSDGRDGLDVLSILTAAQQSMENGGSPVDIEYA